MATTRDAMNVIHMGAVDRVKIKIGLGATVDWKAVAAARIEGAG